jgi:archaellum component FlaC
MTLTASLPKSFSLIPNQDNTKVSLKGAPEGNGAPTPIELGYAEIKEGNVGWRWVNVTGNAPSSKDCKATYDLVAKARIDVFKENKKNSVPVLTIFFTPGQPGKDTPVSVTWPQPPPKSGWPNVAERKAKEDKLILQVEKDASKEFQQQAVWTFEKHEDEKDKLYHLKWVAPTSMPSEGDFLKFRNWLDIAVQGASLTIGNVGDETPRAIMPPVHLAPEAVTESNGVAIPLADHFPWALVPPALEGSPSPVWSPRPGANKTTIEFDRAGTTLVAEFNSDSAGKPRISVSWKEKGSPDALKQNLIDSWRLRDSKLPQERKTAQNALDTAIAQQTKAQEKRDQAQGALKDAKEKQVNCQSEVSKTGVPVLEDELNKTTNDLNKAPKDLEGAPKEIPQLQNELKDPKLAPKDRAQKTQRFRYLENLWKNKKTAISDLQKQVSDLKQRIVDTKKDQEYDKKQAALTTANQKVEQAQQTFDKIEKELPGFQAHVTEAQTQLSDLTKKENTNVGSIKTTEDNLGQFAVASQLEFNIKADKTGALLAVVRIDVPKVEVPSDPKEPKKDQGDGK